MHILTMNNFYNHYNKVLKNIEENKGEHIKLAVIQALNNLGRITTLMIVNNLL